MLLSQYLLPIFKESPAEAVVNSHKLMLRAGMIRKLASGIYAWLPFGLRVLQKIQDEIRREMNSTGAIELLLPMLQPASLWEKSGRYHWGTNMMNETLKVSDKHDVEMFFAPTAEEVITQIFSETIISYKELPKNLYQISTKFRDEIRPRYGVLRSREFYMKDSYSFHIDKSDALLTYETMLKTYIKIFKNLGLTTIPVSANSGDIGGDYTHEFHVLTKVGESKVFFDRGILTALLNKDFCIKMLDNFYTKEEGRHDPDQCIVPIEQLISSRGIEIAQIFYLGDKYSKAMNVRVQTKNGDLIYPMMGCYGIGVSRLVAAYIEANHDEKGIIWHPNIAPFKCMVINLKVGDEQCDALTRCAYEYLHNAGIEILCDDTNESAGVKLARADLIGIPIQIIIGPKNAPYDILELRDRRSGFTITTSIHEIITSVNSHLNYLLHS